MTVATLPAVVPPAPKVFDKDLSVAAQLWKGLQSSLSFWPDYAFDILINKRSSLGITAVLVNDPDGVRHVMMTNAVNYRRPYTVRRVARPLGGDGLFLAEGAQWKRQRKLLAPPFTPASIGILTPHFQEAGLHLLRRIEQSPRINLSQAFQDTALEAVLRALFSLPENDARERLGALARSYVAGPGRPNLFDVFAKSDDDFAFANGSRARFQARWFGAIDQIIQARRADSPDSADRDLLDLLLKLKDAETGDSLSDAEVRDQCATTFFAGSETTARLMFWASYLLTLDKNEQARIRAEVIAFRPEQLTSLDDLQHWPRLRNLLFEAMRLYPPLPMTIRDAIAPDVICGVETPADAQVWMSAWIMHRHRKFWDQPTAFMPDRFAGIAAPWVQIPAYVPFGVGPRICLGLHFALAEAQIVLAQMLSRYAVGVEAGPPVLPIGRVTIEPSYEPVFNLQPL